MTKLMKFTTFSALAVLLAGCPEGEVTEPSGEDVCPAIEQVQEPQTCSSRVDGKVGGEDCRCECDAQCAAGFACVQPGYCLPVACEVDDDFNDGQVCIAATGACSEPICQTNEDCNAGQACIGGTCTSAPDPGSVASCVINGPTVTRQGETADLAVTAYSSGGAVVSQMAYTWSVTAGDTGVAVADGVLTGGNSGVAWTVTATLQGADGVSCSHSGTNFETVAEGNLRVLVMDQRTGGPIAGARVVLVAGGATTESDTQDSGAANFADLAGAVESVSVFFDTDALAADYVTLVAPEGNDLAVYLFTSEKGRKAGMEGSFDFSTLPDRQLKLGLAGASLAGSIADIDFLSLIGDTVQTQLDIPGLPIPEEGIPLPQGVTLQFGPTAAKENFQALTYSGRRTLWGLGGSFRLAAITELLPTIAPLIEDTSAGLPIGQLLGALVPLLAQMQHAAKVGIEVESVACTVGTLPSGDEVDCIEAFGDHFPNHDLKFGSGLDFNTSFAIPTLPAKGEGYLSAVLGLVGVDLPGQGLVPLGIGVGVDDLDTSDDVGGDGQISGANGAQDGAIPVGYARSHSGLDGNGILGLFISLDMDGLLSGGGSDTALSGMVVKADYFAQCGNAASCATQPTRDAFLALPGGASFNRLTRAVTGPASIDGADYYRFGTEGEHGKWTFYMGAGASFTMPTPPEGYADRTAGATVQAFDLSGDHSLASLVGFNALNMDGLNGVTSAFSSVDCIGSGTNCVLTECDEQNVCEEGSSCVDSACVEDEEP